MQRPSFIKLELYYDIPTDLKWAPLWHLEVQPQASNGLLASIGFKRHLILIM